MQCKQSALPLTRLSKNLAPSRKPCFCNLLLENSGKFSKHSVKFHNDGADMGRASFFGASWVLCGAERRWPGPRGDGLGPPGTGRREVVQPKASRHGGSSPLNLHVGVRSAQGCGTVRGSSGISEEQPVV